MEEKTKIERKNNKSVKTAVLLFGAVLITMSLLGGTLAKYTSDIGTASDSARVAKWKVTKKDATLALFKTNYTEHDPAANKDTVVATEKVFAPGTSGEVTLDPTDLGSVNSEAAYRIKLDLDQDKTKYTGDFSNIIGGKFDYNPLRFKVTDGSGTIKYNGFIRNTTSGKVDDGPEQVIGLKNALASIQSDIIYPGEAIGTQLDPLKVKIEWMWEFTRPDLEDDAAAEATSNGDDPNAARAQMAEFVDTWDTELGKRAAEATTSADDLNFNITLKGTAVQVD